MSCESSTIISNEATTNDINDQPPLSKRAKKKMLKKEKWLQYKPIKRAKEKAKLKEKKKLAQLLNIKLGPSRKELKLHKMALSDCRFHVALDFSFDSLMNDKDLHKCINQFNHCYSINRRNPNPLQFSVTSFCGRAKDVMSKHNGYLNWDVNFHEGSYLEVFPKENLIYLTSDSENTIDTLDETKVYIIGALVDHNSQKGLTLKIAEEQKIGHARLPIDEFIKMKTRKVLTIDHVFEILVNVGCHEMSWKDAFLKVIPQRKGVIAKSETSPEKEETNLNGDTPEEVDRGLPLEVSDKKLDPS